MDAFKSVINSPNSLSVDEILYLSSKKIQEGLHLNKEGYKVLTRAVKEKIKM